MLHENGNSVPQGQPPHQQQQQQQQDVRSGSESYTGSSGSYTETASQHHPPQPQQPEATVPRSASRAHRNDHSRVVQPTSSPSPQRQPPAEQFNEGGEDQDRDKKSRSKQGKGKARHMVNAALSAPAARMRAVSASLAGRDSQRVTIYVFFAVALIHLLFVILSCTLSQIDIEGGGCLTFWGYKQNCDSVSYTIRTELLRNCGKLRSSLRAGAAFSILSILTSTATVVVAWLMCNRLRHADNSTRRQSRYRDVDAGTLGTNARQEEGNHSSSNNNPEPTFNPGHLKLATIIIVAISLVLELIAWAVIAGVGPQNHCDASYYISNAGTYGVGFGLGLTAWIMEIIVYVVYIVVV
ncbi:hypothetical protein ABB37_01673 [Leptomonas pyrrhocoris]|uniref:Amastin-like protein n=1 Tax=Leptomonas pyrrhocoris TaxID=157538 RepID=A0A0N0DZI8_LEPPY|nr:hypothetical protein ABB37_01673 [Leptomonas pyrrhocoris]XP_015663787.1 hypothetical protein ABB37_01673 [Leptomonas pyrrhocoris]KPA85347.1 hypothetical protein ABB37_01673 [Leptomonas pyrrhocoris]KPA85348.1 hypothetical protein ABB37_01673 [Leptomonas pyrrhocoris]|eukprot:XP_015663786.1 hypothetical protein ABB37_01673 [Leptomonas pyrrhocoris]